MAIAGQGQYDPNWMITHNISMECLTDFTSKRQLDDLISHGVFQVGDRFAMTFTSRGGNVRTKKAKLTSVQNSKNPIFRIQRQSSTRPSVFEACGGPTELATQMKRVWEPRYSTDGRPGRNWFNIRVFRGGQDLGSMWKVRQQYHLWVEEKVRWSAGFGVRNIGNRVQTSILARAHDANTIV